MRITLLFYLVFLGVNAQSQSLEVELNSDSILLGNVISVNFHIKDTNGEFEAPDFEDMTIVSGPNVSSSVQIINGDMTSSKSVNFLLRPSEVGHYYIPPAYVIEDDYTLETEPLEFNVYPNPDGIIENPVMQNNFTLRSFEWPSFDFGFGSERAIPKEKEQPGKPKQKLKKI